MAPEAFTVGEAWDNTDIVLEYIDAGLHTCFEFDLASATIAAVNAANPALLAVEGRRCGGGLTHSSSTRTFLTNHDQNRIIEQLGRNEAGTRWLRPSCSRRPACLSSTTARKWGCWGQARREHPAAHAVGCRPNAGFTTGTPWHALNTNAGQWNVETLAADPAHCGTIIGSWCRPERLRPPCVAEPIIP